MWYLLIGLLIGILIMSVASVNGNSTFTFIGAGIGFIASFFIGRQIDEF